MITNYDDEMLQQINENVDLIEYVSQTMKLERNGKEYFTHCPLHKDIVPSLFFSPSKNKYHCFSCGKSGGVIGFFLDYEGLKFEDAVKKAARLANIDLNTMCQSKTITFLRKMKSLSESKKEPYKHKVLSSSELEKYRSEPVEEWMDEGIEPYVMDIFDVRVDDLQNRIVYPVYDIDGKLINIKGRTRYQNFKEMRIPKYINYFKVGTMDYFQGLNITLQYVNAQNEIIIFESIKSVMKAYGWGYRNCVSAETHNLSKEQIDLLVKLRVNVVLAYDSDIDYRRSEVKSDIEKLKRITNVYIVEDRKGLLGGADAKNAPVDLGEEIWTQLYQQKRKIV